MKEREKIRKKLYGLNKDFEMDELKSKVWQGKDELPEEGLFCQYCEKIIQPDEEKGLLI